jgi:IS30 family transposase
MPASGRYLSLAEREEVAIGRARGPGVRETARHLGRSPSTTSRELRRNAITRAGPSAVGRRSPSGTQRAAGSARSKRLAHNEKRVPSRTARRVSRDGPTWEGAY